MTLQVFCLVPCHRVGGKCTDRFVRCRIGIFVLFRSLGRGLVRMRLKALCVEVRNELKGRLPTNWEKSAFPRPPPLGTQSSYDA